MILQIPLGISNVFLLKGERPILVDSGRPKDADVIIAALAKENVALGDLSLILHTHGHWDHCGSTRRLKELTSAPAAIHRGDADKLRHGDNGILHATCLTGFLLKPWLNRSFPAVEPGLILDGETDLRPFGVPARVIHTPGHTAGSISILAENGEAIIGDLLMGGYWGGKLFRRRPNLHYYAEDLPTLYGSLNMLISHSPSRVYVGHGGPLDAKAIRRRFRIAEGA